MAIAEVEQEVKGSTLPRLYTLPLEGRRQGDAPPGECPCGCAHTGLTTRGFEVIRWAQDVLKVSFNPWQQWLLIHALELSPDGSLRFRTILVLVARQNGKTLVNAVLTLWLMLEGNARYLVGTAQDLSQAREVMNEVLVPMMLDCEALHDRFNPDAEDSAQRRGVWHRVWSDEYFRLDTRWRGSRQLPGADDPRYLIKALNRKAGRGLAGVAKVDIDELREQRDHLGWAAISHTVLTIPEAQIWCMSNAGDSQSIVLNHLRGVALAGTDPTLFHAEWSAPDGCALDDVEMWAQANPSLGYTLPVASVRSALQTDPPNVFRTEVLCQGVDVLNTAIDPGAWAACADPGGAMPDLRPMLVVESALEGEQVIAIAGVQMADGRVRLDVVGIWDDTTKARRGLPELKTTLRPQAIGWFPKGPGAVLSAALQKMGAVPIRGTQVAEACMTFADYVDGRRLLHPDDPILNDHARHTGTVGSAASWIFDRAPGETHGVWAAAGALHLVLNNPAPVVRRRRVLMGDE